jgi:protein gp37
VSENTAIGWTDHTLNLISGCTKISAGCVNCYAANLPPAMRRHAEWGPNAERKFAPESYIAQVYGWERRAAKTGIRERVFGPSVADPFEGPHGPGGEGRNGPREDYLPVIRRMFNLAVECPHLDFQVLTKRPWNAVAWWKASGLQSWPRNLWIGTSVEDQRAADERVPYLVELPAAVRFLSCEPLLERVCLPLTGIRWVIVGGESGRKARQMYMAWADHIIGDCQCAGVPVFMKQMGTVTAEACGYADKKGGDPSEWPTYMRVQEFPAVPHA